MYTQGPSICGNVLELIRPLSGERPQAAEAQTSGGVAKPLKTFEEACDAVLCRKVPVEQEAMPEDFMMANARYHDTLGEIQNHPRTRIVVLGMFDLLSREGFPDMAIAAVLFAHGVMVGMEMEKTES